MNLGFSPLLLVGAAILLNDCAVDGLGHASMAAQQTQGRVEGKVDPNITELSPAPVDWYGRKKITARRRSEKDQSEVSPTPRAVTERRLNKKPTVNTPAEEGTGTPPASKSSPENKQTNNQNDPNNAVLAHGAPKVQADTYYNVSSKREGMTLIWTQNQAATATPESVRDGGRHKRSRDKYGPYGRSCQCKNCNINPTNAQKGNLVNIAVNQPATSSSMYRTQEPCFAVNGRTSGDMRDRGNNYPNCFHSGSNDNAFTWWSVDLQSEYTIAQLEVYRRTLDNYRDALRMQGIVITINGMVCYTYPTLNNKAALASIPHHQTVRCVEPLRGRHVMLQKRVGIPTENDYKFIQICEIRIYVFDRSSRRYGDPRDSRGTACPRGCLCDNFYGCSRRVLFNVAHKKMATTVCDRDSQVTVNGFVDYPSYADVRRHCITCSVSATQKKAWAIRLFGVFHIYYLLVKNRHHTLGDMNELYIYIYERSERLGRIPNNWTLCNHFQGAFRTNTEKNFTCKNAPIVGVYVAIVAPPGVRLNLCEVQIIGQPVYFQDLTAVGCSRSTSFICKNPFICEQNKCKHRVGAGCSNTITNVCANGSFCDDSLCRLPVGAYCKETPDSCVKHAECDASQGHVCKMSSGGPCANTGQCANVASGYVCDSLKRCKIGAGRTCSSFAVCGAGSTCMSSRCVCIPGKSHIFQSDQFCSPLNGRVGGGCSSIRPNCTEDASCDTSLHCRCNTDYTIESTDFSCKLADVFKPCDRDSDCNAGQVCQNRHCKLAIGKHCFEARECMDEAICDIKVYKCLINSGRSCANNIELCNTGADCLNGTCKSRLGERCEEGQDQCVEDTVCSITSDNQTRCLLEVGLTCGRRRDMCRSGAFCDAGSVCRFRVGELCDQSSANLCQYRSKCQYGQCKLIVGAGCTGNEDKCEGNATCDIFKTCRLARDTPCSDLPNMCLSGATCDGGFCVCQGNTNTTNPDICAPLEGMVAAKCGSNNSVCTSLSVCNENTQICECLGGLAPDRIDFTCGPGEGMDCTEENTKCVAGMVCDAAGCSLDAGESCEGKRQSHCRTGTLCDVDNICRLELGQDCNANPDSCKMGYVCDASLTCRIPVGDLCGVSENCVAGGFCVNSKCSCTKGLTSKVGLICSPQDGLTGGRCTRPANTCIGDDAVCNSIHRRCVCQNGYQMEPHNLQCKKKAGESCETDDDCAAGRSCNSVSRQCSLLLGESCFGPLSNNCGTEATCDITYECKLNIDGDCSDERVVLCKQGTFCDWLKKCRLNIGANCSENNECPTGGLCEQQTCQCQQGTATAFEVLCEPETGRVGASCNAVDSPCNLEGTQCLDGVCACTGGLKTTQTFTCFGVGASKATSEANGSTWLVATLVAALGLTVAFVVGFAHFRRENKKKTEELNRQRRESMVQLRKLSDEMNAPNDPQNDGSASIFEPSLSTSDAESDIDPSGSEFASQTTSVFESTTVVDHDERA